MKWTAAAMAIALLSALALAQGPDAPGAATIAAPTQSHGAALR